MDSAGGAPVTALKPWTACLEGALRAHKDLQKSEGLLALFRALLSRHGEKDPLATVGDGRGVNALVAASLSYEGGGAAPRPCDKAQWGIAQRDLPGYAQHLEQVCGGGGAAVPAHTELAVLAEDLVAAFHGPPRGGRGERPLKMKFESSAQKKYCESFRDHVRRVSDLQELLQYRDLLAAHSRQGDEKELRKRIEERVFQLKQEGLVSHEALERQYVALSHSFPKSDCFFGDGVKKPASARRKRQRL